MQSPFMYHLLIFILSFSSLSHSADSPEISHDSIMFTSFQFQNLLERKALECLNDGKGNVAVDDGLNIIRHNFLPMNDNEMDFVNCSMRKSELISSDNHFRANFYKNVLQVKLMVKRVVAEEILQTCSERVSKDGRAEVDKMALFLLLKCLSVEEAAWKITEATTDEKDGGFRNMIKTKELIDEFADDINEEREKMIKMKEEMIKHACAKAFNIRKELVDALIEAYIIPDSPQIDGFIHCFMIKSGSMDVDGSVDIQFYERRNPELIKKNVDNLTSCLTEIPKELDIKRKSYFVQKCVHQLLKNKKLSTILGTSTNHQELDKSHETSKNHQIKIAKDFIEKVELLSVLACAGITKIPDDQAKELIFRRLKPRTENENELYKCFMISAGYVKKEKDGKTTMDFDYYMTYYTNILSRKYSTVAPVRERYVDHRDNSEVENDYISKIQLFPEEEKNVNAIGSSCKNAEEGHPLASCITKWENEFTKTQTIILKPTWERNKEAAIAAGRSLGVDAARSLQLIFGAEKPNDSEKCIHLEYMIFRGYVLPSKEMDWSSFGRSSTAARECRQSVTGHDTNTEGHSVTGTEKKRKSEEPLNCEEIRELFLCLKEKTFHDVFYETKEEMVKNVGEREKLCNLPSEVKQSESRDLELFPYSDEEKEYVFCLIEARDWNLGKTNGGEPHFSWEKYHQSLWKEKKIEDIKDMIFCAENSKKPDDNILHLYMCLTSKNFRTFMKSGDNDEVLEGPWIKETDVFCSNEAKKVAKVNDDGNLIDDLITNGLFPRQHNGEARYLSCFLIKSGFLSYKTMYLNWGLFHHLPMDLVLPRSLLNSPKGQEIYRSTMERKYGYGLLRISNGSGNQDVHTLEDHYAALFHKTVLYTYVQVFKRKHQNELGELLRKREKMALERCKNAHTGDSLVTTEGDVKTCTLKKIGYMKQDNKMDWEWFKKMNEDLYPTYPTEKILDKCDPERKKTIARILSTLRIDTSGKVKENPFDCIQKYGNRDIGQ